MAYVDLLVMLYSPLSVFSDNKLHNIPWNLISEASVRLIIEYTINHKENDATFLARNLNQVARTFSISVEQNDISAIAQTVNQLSKTCYDLSSRESNAHEGKIQKDYAGKYYFNVFVSVVMVLKGCLERSRQISNKVNNPLNTRLYHQNLMCLFYLNFIALDVGTIDFEMYEYVYEVSCSGIELFVNQSRDSQSLAYYTHILNTMKGNIWFQGPQTKVDTSKLLFLLGFIERTIGKMNKITPTFFTEIIEPLQLQCMKSSSPAITESIHSMNLALFDNVVSGKSLLVWLTEYYMKYINLSITQYLDGKITDLQLILIYQRLGSKLPTLQTFDKDLSRKVLHFTYFKIVNCSPNELEEQANLTKCMMFLLPFITEKYKVDWLNNIKELITTLKFNKNQYNELVFTLWDVISSIKSDTCLRWWYIHRVHIQGSL